MNYGKVVEINFVSSNPTELVGRLILLYQEERGKSFHKHKG